MRTFIAAALLVTSLTSMLAASASFAAAVKAAGMVDTLKGKDPFTVFAPTNAAFGKLPVGTVETLSRCMTVKPPCPRPAGAS